MFHGERVNKKETERERGGREGRRESEGREPIAAEKMFNTRRVREKSIK